MNIYLSLLICSIAGLGALFGSLLVFIPNISKNAYMSTIMAFSGSVMIYISVGDLIPSSVSSIIDVYSGFKAMFMIIIPFVIGVILINILDKQIKEESSLKKVGVLSLLSLMIHNFPEGIATFMSSMLDLKLGITLSLAIMFHNIPEGICIAVPISEATNSKTKGILYSLFSSVAEPLGAILAYIFLRNYINNLTIGIILLFVSGMMITLSINSIYKESLNLGNKKNFILGILLSIIYIIISKII